MLLGVYVAVPLGCLLIYDSLSGELDHFIASLAELPKWRQRLRRLATTRWLWLPIIIGSTGVYYAVFTAMLLAIAAVLAALRARRLRALVPPIACAVAVLAVLAFTRLPTLVYQIEHGSNDVAAQRQLGESDVYGLHVSELLLPSPDHRVQALADLSQQTENSNSPVPLVSTERENLGMLAAAGFVIAILAVFGSAIGGRRRSDHWSMLRRHSGILCLAAILLGAIGGISTIIALAGFLEIRSYVRLSIFIAFFALVTVGTILEPWLARLETRRHGRVAVPIVLGALVLLAAFDQVPLAPTGRREATQQAVGNDASFARTIAARLPAGSMVEELPLMGYPEKTIFDSESGKLFAYDLVKPSLYTSRLRWSYGAMEGRPADIQPSLANLPVHQYLARVAAIGYAGIYIDTSGFRDHALTLIPALQHAIGTPPISSANHQLVFFDLRAYARRITRGMSPQQQAELRTRARNPVQLTWGDGFQPVAGDRDMLPHLPDYTSFRWASNGAQLELSNPLPNTRTITIHLSAHIYDRRGEIPQGWTLRVRFRGHELRIPMLPGHNAVGITLRVPDGDSVVTFASSRPDVLLTLPPPHSGFGPPVAFQLFNTSTTESTTAKRGPLLMLEPHVAATSSARTPSA